MIPYHNIGGHIRENWVDAPEYQQAQPQPRRRPEPLQARRPNAQQNIQPMGMQMAPARAHGFSRIGARFGTGIGMGGPGAYDHTGRFDNDFELHDNQYYDRDDESSTEENDTSDDSVTRDEINALREQVHDLQNHVDTIVMHTVEALQHSTRRAGAHERTLVGLGARIQQLELRSGDHGNGLQTVFEAAERDRETHSRRCAAAEQNLGNQESAINDLRQQMATSKCPCKQQIIASDPFDYQAAHQSRAAGKRPAVPSDYDTENEPLKQYVAERTRNPYAGQPRKPSPVRSDEDQGINVYGTDMQGHRTAQSPPHQGARDNSYPTRLKAPPPPRVVAGPSKQNQTQQPGGMRGEGDFCGGRNTGYDTNGVVPCRQRRRRRVWCDGCECGVNYD